MITIKQKGNFNKTNESLKKMKEVSYRRILEKYGRLGVTALSAATPVDSSKTANSWSYEIITKGSGLELTWTNSNENDGVPIAILIQYGHGTGTGGYVSGIDYINPAIKPIMDGLARDVWGEVTKL